MQRCSFCVTSLVDRACAESGITLTAHERRQVVAGLLARRHLILCGPKGSRKCDLASAIALAFTDGNASRLCTLQGHPWWASRTAEVGHYASMQSAYTAWRLVYFLESALNGRQDPSGRHDAGCDHGYVVCVDRMSQAELDFYFGVLPYRLQQDEQGHTHPVPVWFIGTIDSDAPPALDTAVLQMAALVQL